MNFHSCNWEGNGLCQIQKGETRTKPTKVVTLRQKELVKNLGEEEQIRWGAKNCGWSVSVSLEKLSPLRDTAWWCLVLVWKQSMAPWRSQSWLGSYSALSGSPCDAILKGRGLLMSTLDPTLLPNSLGCFWESVGDIGEEGNIWFSGTPFWGAIWRAKSWQVDYRVKSHSLFIACVQLRCFLEMSPFSYLMLHDCPINQGAWL